MVDSFLLPSANLGERVTAVVSEVMVRITENALQKRKPISATKYIPWSLWKGYVTAFEITSASVDDREGLRNLVEEKEGL